MNKIDAGTYHGNDDCGTVFFPKTMERISDAMRRMGRFWCDKCDAFVRVKGRKIGNHKNAISMHCERCGTLVRFNAP